MFGLARQAKHYQRWAGLLATPLYRRVVADLAAAQLPAGAVVLDVGSGPGRVPMTIAERCPQLSVSGIDLSLEMMARATAVAARRSGGHSVAFQVADVVALPFVDQSMDLVVSAISLHHWDNPAAGPRDIIRVLRPGQRMEVPLVGSLQATRSADSSSPGTRPPMSSTGAASAHRSPASRVRWALVAYLFQLWAQLQPLVLPQPSQT